MADVTIHDLSARSGAIAASDQFEVDDGNSSTDTEKATFAQLGGLAYSASSVTTGNVTATVGTLHALDLSGLTADRNFVLPDSAQVGERIGVFVATGDDTYELDIVTAAAGSLINGADAGSGTSWSRLFITNECVTFRCVNAGGAGDTDWIVEYDGRIPCHGRMDDDNGTANHYTDATMVTPDWSTGTVQINVGDICNQTSERFDIRRAGQYLMAVDGITPLVIPDQNQVAWKFRLDPDGTPSDLMSGRNFMSSGATGRVSLNSTLTRALSAGDSVDVQVFVDGSASAYTWGTTEWEAVKMSVVEVLP